MKLNDAILGAAFLALSIWIGLSALAILAWPERRSGRGPFR